MRDDFALVVQNFTIINLVKVCIVLHHSMREDETDERMATAPVSPSEKWICSTCRGATIVFVRCTCTVGMRVRTVDTRENTESVAHFPSGRAPRACLEQKLHGKL